MKPNETAKSCPSKEEKKPKVHFLLATFMLVGRVGQALKGIEALWQWIKPYWTPVWEWIRIHWDLI